MIRSLSQGLGRYLFMCRPLAVHLPVTTVLPVHDGVREFGCMPILALQSNKVLNGSSCVQRFSTTISLQCQMENEEEEGDEGDKRDIDPAKDRRIPIPLETSLKYLQSEAYKSTYGEDPVWKKYRRNFKGPFPKKKTRKTCIRGGIISAGNPCPACRDEYLVLDYRNIELLKQFISPYNGAILPAFKTNLCRKRHRELVVAVLKARDYGLLPYDVPHRNFDYSEFYPEWRKDNRKTTE